MDFGGILITMAENPKIPEAVGDSYGCIDDEMGGRNCPLLFFSSPLNQIFLIWGKTNFRIPNLGIPQISIALRMRSSEKIEAKIVVNREILISLNVGICNLGLLSFVIDEGSKGKLEEEKFEFWFSCCCS